MERAVLSCFQFPLTTSAELTNQKIKMDNSEEYKFDCLMEAVNIGMGHSAEALSRMIERKVLISPTTVELVPSEVFFNKISQDHSGSYIGVFLDTAGDISGVLLFIFKLSDALQFCDLLSQRSCESSDVMDEGERSAVREMGSIMAGSFLSVLADMLNLSVYHKSPILELDSVSAIFNAVCESAFGNREQRNCFATEFQDPESLTRGYFAFVPTSACVDKIVEGLDEFRKKRT